VLPAPRGGEGDEAPSYNNRLRAATGVGVGLVEVVPVDTGLPAHPASVSARPAAAIRSFIAVPLTPVELAPEEVAALKQAVEATGPIDGLWPGQYDAYIHALASFMGGPLESVDAFVTSVAHRPRESRRVRRADPAEFGVLWLRGNSIGALVASPPPQDGDPPDLGGWVRPVSKIWELEFRSAEFEGLEVLPTVRIHFEHDSDVIVEVRVSGREDQFARDQAATFLVRLQQAVAGQSEKE
jgi:hypothetical protein